MNDITLVHSGFFRYVLPKIRRERCRTATSCKYLRTYHPLLENIMRIRLAFGENETVIPLGLTETILGLPENSLRTSGWARIH
jgi:hypothetical protein